MLVAIAIAEISAHTTMLPMPRAAQSLRRLCRRSNCEEVVISIIRHGIV